MRSLLVRIDRIPISLLVFMLMFGISLLGFLASWFEATVMIMSIIIAMSFGAILHRNLTLQKSIAWLLIGIILDLSGAIDGVFMLKIAEAIDIQIRNPQWLKVALLILAFVMLFTQVAVSRWRSLSRIFIFAGLTFAMGATFLIHYASVHIVLNHASEITQEEVKQTLDLNDASFLNYCQFSGEQCYEQKLTRDDQGAIHSMVVPSQYQHQVSSVRNQIINSGHPGLRVWSVMTDIRTIPYVIGYAFDGYSERVVISQKSFASWHSLAIKVFSILSAVAQFAWFFGAFFTMLWHERRSKKI